MIVEVEIQYWNGEIQKYRPDSVHEEGGVMKLCSKNHPDLGLDMEILIPIRHAKEIKITRRGTLCLRSVRLG